MTHSLPEWLDPTEWLVHARTAGARAVEASLRADDPGERGLAALLSAAASERLEALAQRAQALTRRHFGRTVKLYVPLYLSNYCSSGCAYCGFAGDRRIARRRLTLHELDEELLALSDMGFDEVLLLTGERSEDAGFPFLRRAVERAAELFGSVGVEAFAMSRTEYATLARSGCTSVTVYQETYEPDRYLALHRWGPKRDYWRRLSVPAGALAAGVRTVGLGALLGLGEPTFEMLCLYRHVGYLRQRFWRAGVSVSFPRVRPQAGGYKPEFAVDERMLAQIVFAFRICLPDVPLVLSTRERAEFRRGMAGVGITKMSAASRTGVGGYARAPDRDEQFAVSDRSCLADVQDMLRGRGLEPVLKDWEAIYR